MDSGFSEVKYILMVADMPTSIIIFPLLMTTLSVNNMRFCKEDTVKLFKDKKKG